MSELLRQATTLPALVEAARRASAGKRDRPEVARFMMDLERECLRLGRALRMPVGAPGSWEPGRVRTYQIRERKLRTISVLPFEDRVVHHALCAALEPCFERYAIHHSYACRVGKGSEAALLHAQALCRRAPWVFKIDIRAHFASIPHNRLMRLVASKVRDRALCARLAQILEAGVDTPGRGLPIGALTSQHLANLYLGVMDHWIKDELGMKHYLRYMDDALVLAERAVLARLRVELERFLQDRLELELNHAVSELMPVRDGVPFLGMRVFPGVIRLDGRRWRRARKLVANLELQAARGELGEAALAGRVQSIFSQLRVADSHRLRVAYVRRRYGVGGGGHYGLQPREPGRLLERPPAEPASGEPRQGRSVQAQRQPGLSSGELDTGISAGLTGIRADGGGSRTVLLSHGVDQASLLRPVSARPCGIESRRPEGGLRSEADVVFGPFSFPAGPRIKRGG